MATEVLYNSLTNRDATGPVQVKTPDVSPGNSMEFPTEFPRPPVLNLSSSGSEKSLLASVPLTPVAATPPQNPEAPAEEGTNWLAIAFRVVKIVIGMLLGAVILATAASALYFTAGGVNPLLKAFATTAGAALGGISGGILADYI
jgi:hypothetical protein